MQQIRSKVLLVAREPVLLRIHYWMPDYNNILQEFLWQCMDVQPDYPRVNNFLEYWKNNIEAVIHTVEISDGGRAKSSTGR